VGFGVEEPERTEEGADFGRMFMEALTMANFRPVMQSSMFFQQVELSIF
jgi:hypothetical protein